MAAVVGSLVEVGHVRVTIPFALASDISQLGQPPHFLIGHNPSGRGSIL